MGPFTSHQSPNVDVSVNRGRAPHLTSRGQGHRCSLVSDAQRREGRLVGACYCSRKFTQDNLPPNLKKKYIYIYAINETTGQEPGSRLSSISLSLEGRSQPRRQFSQPSHLLFYQQIRTVKIAFKSKLETLFLNNWTQMKNDAEALMDCLQMNFA